MALERVRIAESRIPAFACLTLGVLLAAGSILGRGRLPGVLLVVAAYLAILLIAAGLWWASQVESLVLTAEGFSWDADGMRGRLDWEDVSEFAAMETPEGFKLMFRFQDTYPRASALKFLHGAVPGYDAAVPYSFHGSSEELIAALNRYRMMALHARASFTS